MKCAILICKYVLICEISQNIAGDDYEDKDNQANH
jgi:hypothetical protein